MTCLDISFERQNQQCFIALELYIHLHWETARQGRIWCGSGGAGWVLGLGNSRKRRLTNTSGVRLRLLKSAVLGSLAPTVIQCLSPRWLLQGRIWPPRPTRRSIPRSIRDQHHCSGQWRRNVRRWRKYASVVFPFSINAIEYTGRKVLAVTRCCQHKKGTQDHRRINREVSERDSEIQRLLPGNAICNIIAIPILLRQWCGEGHLSTAQ